MVAKLHPTLWRTCRILSGKTRLELFRLIAGQPDQTVSELARRLDLSLPRASQELRRLQSRGLVQAVRNSRQVRYRPVADRLVASAPPLLAAMQATFRAYPAAEDEQTLRIATAFSHPRRLALASLLLKGPWPRAALLSICGMSPDGLRRHLNLMRRAGVARREKGVVALVDNPHPLAQGLFGLLREATAPPA